MMSIDVANRNGPAVTPPASLSLRSSHNRDVSGGDVTRLGWATFPKCRKKYCLTSIQSAMGLSDVTLPPSSSTPNKLAKNGLNALRKAAERHGQHDHNKNTTPDPDSTTAERHGQHDHSKNTTPDPDSTTAERHGQHDHNKNTTPDPDSTTEDCNTNNETVNEDILTKMNLDPDTKIHLDLKTNVNSDLDLKTNVNSDLESITNVTDDGDDISILSEKEVEMKIEEEERSSIDEEEEERIEEEEEE
ncbi:probable serine/threonine-protein kinase DDB_G0282963, partial [Oncorhynchus clarkii lewisi]|uniref:probable serine/threonine-protein kinase DDB_G0282963 n=1 Tax=Oncorhynchus clarkii lewisi TaxID=490388 RepID=UPI0039B829E4